MTCTQALLSLFLFAPCNDGGGGPQATYVAARDSARPEADLARDANRKPYEVLDFFGIQSGMTVLEVFAGGGYYTQILDGVVGPDGKVLAHNNQGYLNFVGPQFEARFADGGLPNTEQLIGEANDLSLAPKSLDAALLTLAWHDFLFGSEEYNWPDVDEAVFVDALCEAMKPGAVLGIVDHYANAEDDPTQAAFGLHRIDPERIQSDLSGTCFKFEAGSDLLRNPQDDHSTSATEGEFQGNTDRFILKYVRK